MSQVLARFRNSWIPHGLIVTVILTVVVGFVCLTVRRANMGLADLNENKRARQTIATVKRKEKMCCTQTANQLRKCVAHNSKSTMKNATCTSIGQLKHVIHIINYKQELYKN